MTLQAGLIGTGRVGQNHAEAYDATDGVELQAIADIDANRRTESGDRHGIPEHRRYREYETMIDEEQLDIVSVATPAGAHYDHVCTLVRSQPDISVVWCEKPIATSVRHAETMVSMCDDADIELVVNHLRRFSYAHEELRELLEEGIFGTVESVRVTTDGEFLNIGTHYVDLLLYLLDATIADVRGGHVETVRSSNEVRYAGGGTFTLDTGTTVYIDPVEAAPHRLSIHGTQATISAPLNIAPDAGTSWDYWRIEDGSRTRTEVPNSLQERWETDISGLPTGYEPGDVPAQSLFENAAGHIVDLAAGKRDNAAPGSRAAHGLAGLTGLVASATTGSRIPLPMAGPLREISLAHET